MARGEPHALLRRASRCSTFALLLLCQAAASAQPAVPPRQPSTPHEALSLFEGTWTVEPSPAADFKEVSAWVPRGRRHMVCRSTWSAGGDPRESLSIFSHAAVGGQYLYHGFRPGGSVSAQRGTVVDGVWTFRGSTPAGVQARVTITPTAAGFTLVEEAAGRDGAWADTGRVQYKRMPP